MPHIHDAPGQHDFTTSAFIVRTDGPEPTIMLHFHRKVDVFLQFGGHIELDETPWQGLVRELREESGYSPDQFVVLQPHGRFREHFARSAQHPLPFYFNTHPFKSGMGHKHSDLAYAVIVDGPPHHQIDAGESADIRELTASQLRAMPQSEIFDQTRENALFILEHLMHDWVAVPASEWPA